MWSGDYGNESDDDGCGVGANGECHGRFAGRRMPLDVHEHLSWVATKARLWAWDNVKELDGLLEILIDATISFLSLQAKSGAECLMLFDTWASAVPAVHRDWLITKPAYAIIQGLRKNGYQQPVIGFAKGIGEGVIQYAEESGIDAIGLDHSMDPSWANKNLPRKLPVQGNLDPLSLMSAGKKMLREVDHIIESFHSRPHIFNLGHGITPTTPIENVQLMIDHIRNG